MLTQLRFRNWRSLKDATIDFTTPITVFIGANSSGKTNILDGIKFYRDSLQRGVVQVVNENGYRKIQTDALQNAEDVVLEYTFKLPGFSDKLIREKQVLQFDKRDVPFKFGNTLYEDEVVLRESQLRELPVRQVIESFSFSMSGDEHKRYERGGAILTYLYRLAQTRWQILAENFYPPTTLSYRVGGDLYVIDPDAQNMVLILNFMRQAHPDVYAQLQEDFAWMLGHVKSLDIWQQPETRDLELLLREQERTAPTISTGTSRLLAILTAVYALDMPHQENDLEQTMITPDMPGLVVIEEPDTALNPGLLRNFVEQLRNYTEDPERPRQFILTTHNPYFLNWFKPDEVRIVERDEQGYTSVQPISEAVRSILLDKYPLGEVWTTRAMGGVPET